MFGLDFCLSTVIGFSQAGDSNNQLVWDAKLTGANITALGPTVRGVVLEAETREPVNTFLTSGSFDYFEGTWIVVGAGIASLDGGILPGLYIEQEATIRSPKILGGNPGVLAGPATFGTLTSGNLAANGFTVGFGVGVVNNIINSSGTNSVNASLSALAGISIPIRGSLDDPNPDSYPPFL